MNIHYIKGDATAPVGDGVKIIVHICNDVGGWGKGFVMAISNRWKEPELQYRAWAKSKEGFGLGEVQFVQAEKMIWVANVIGQHDIKRDKSGNAPIRYEAVSKGLTTVSAFAKQYHASIHMPRIGCGLAGGTWDKIEPLIKNELTDKQVDVFVYDFS